MLKPFPGTFFRRGEVVLLTCENIVFEATISLVSLDAHSLYLDCKPMIEGQSNSLGLSLGSDGIYRSKNTQREIKLMRKKSSADA